MRRFYYVTCPKCGANNDPGERCDCEKEQSEQERCAVLH